MEKLLQGESAAVALLTARRSDDAACLRRELAFWLSDERGSDEHQSTLQALALRAHVVPATVEQLAGIPAADLYHYAIAHTCQRFGFDTDAPERAFVAAAAVAQSLVSQHEAAQVVLTDFAGRDASPSARLRFGEVLVEIIHRVLEGAEQVGVVDSERYLRRWGLEAALPTA